MLACVGLLLLASCERRGGGVPGNPRVVVLGFDGVDPTLLERFRAAGRLPNLDAVIARGDLRSLGTTTPPLSPVAWSSFATGLPPSDHGVFGLVRREPGTYRLASAAQALEPPIVWMGVPLRPPALRSLRAGRSFWRMAGAAGRRSVVLRVPYGFPEPGGDGERKSRVLGGVGVPDAGLAVSRYTVLAGAGDAAEAGPRMRSLDWDGARGQATLAPIELAGRESAAPTVGVERSPGGLRIRLGDDRALVKAGRWSEPLAFAYDLGPFLSVPATVRFFVRAVEPPELFVSAPSLDPRDAWLAVSTPDDFAARLWAQVGFYDSIGWSQPTEAYEDGWLDADGFLRHVAFSLDWLRRATLHEIDQRDAELVVAVFTETDRVTHLFHREMESGEDAAVEDVYRAMDRIVGDVARHLPDGTRLLVVSDHGFSAFTRAVSVNRWLVERGWQARTSAGDGLRGVDWSRTRAYALGLGQVYLNLRGREPQGIVAPGAEADALLTTIADGLGSLVDPADGGPVVASVDRGRAVFAGPFEDRAPDLLVSFVPGARMAFVDGTGGAATTVVAPNPGRWSGDHGAGRARDVPGVLVSSEPLRAGSASLLDVAPTVLDWLEVPIPEQLPGRSLARRR